MPSGITHTHTAQPVAPRSSGGLFLFLAALPPVIACAAGVAVSADPSGEFYSASAQVIVTLFVVLAGLLGLLAPRLDPAAAKTSSYLSTFALAVLFSTFFGLGTSLYALAAEGTTFLCVGAASTIAVQVFIATFFTFFSASPGTFSS